MAQSADLRPATAPVAVPRRISQRTARFLVYGVSIFILLVVTAIMLTILPSEDNTGNITVSAMQPAQQIEIVPATVTNPPVQAQIEPEITLIPEWPSIAPDWEYTTVIPPMPIGGEGIYNGRASGTTWGTPSARDTPDNEERRRIAQHIVPSITERDAVGLSIVKNPDNPDVFLAAVHIARDVQTRAELVALGDFAKEAELSAAEIQESYLGLSLDNQGSWIILESPNSIDHVIVTGTSSLHLEIRPFGSPGYFKTDVSP